MTYDNTLSVQSLWVGKVCRLSVGKMTGFEVVDGHLDGERGIRCNGIAVLGILELG